MTNDFHNARVARLRRLVATGAYRIDADAVATSLLRRPSSLLVAPASSRRQPAGTSRAA
jgi:hypothetical protein